MTQLVRVVPNWQHAPSWANYVAMDQDGSWWWHEFEPTPCGSTWGGGGRVHPVSFGAWRETMSERPK